MWLNEHLQNQISRYGKTVDKALVMIFNLKIFIFL